MDNLCKLFCCYSPLFLFFVFWSLKHLESLSSNCLWASLKRDMLTVLFSEKIWIGKFFLCYTLSFFEDGLGEREGEIDTDSIVIFIFKSIANHLNKFNFLIFELIHKMESSFNLELIDRWLINERIKYQWSRNVSH